MLELRYLDGSRRYHATDWKYFADSQSTHDVILQRDSIHPWGIRDYSVINLNHYKIDYKIPVINLGYVIPEATYMDYINPQIGGNVRARYNYNHEIPSNWPTINSYMKGRIEIGYNSSKRLCSIKVKMLQFENQEISADSNDLKIVSNYEGVSTVEYIYFEIQTNTNTSQRSAAYFQIIDSQNVIRDVIIVPEICSSTYVSFGLYVIKSGIIDTDVTNTKQIFLMNYAENKFSPDQILSKMNSNDIPLYHFDSSYELRIIDSGSSAVEMQYMIGPMSFQTITLEGDATLEGRVSQLELDVRELEGAIEAIGTYLEEEVINKITNLETSIKGKVNA